MRADIEGIARLLGILALTLYIVGLIAVNGYLYSLGVTDFSLVRTRFIYTGALLASFLVLPYALLTGAITLAKRPVKSGKRGWGRTAVVMAFLLVLILPALFISALYAVNLRDRIGPEGLEAAIWAILPAYVSGIFHLRIY